MEKGSNYMLQNNITEKYKYWNKSALKGGIVFFGADWLSNIPIAEFAKDWGIDIAVHNRSIKGLLLKDAEKVLECCVCDLAPEKVFINIGENDIKYSAFNANEFREQYEWMLYNIHSKCTAKIYILSIIGDRYKNANHILKQLAEKYGCEYIDIQNCSDSPDKFFSKIRFYLRCSSITFYEAMTM